ncbi:MAG: hypothetical protein E7426_00595 [Ruminococcaceae bacterium]|nr:hypothetical protein [Oscillospiraceae bacterium]
MEWEVVKIENEAKGRTSPYASIGFGRISLSVAACKLITNYRDYQFVELLQGKRNGKKCIGVRFLHASERTQQSLPIREKRQGEKLLGGIDIVNKGTLEKLFGPAASASKVTRYNVELDDSDNRILVIFAD